MSDPPLDQFLRGFPLLGGLAPAHLDVLARHASEVEFAAGEVVFRYGGPANRVYLVREGRIAIEVTSPHAGAVTLQTLGAGEVLGFSWLFPPYQWYFDARAVEPSRAVALDGPAVRARCEEDPALGYALMKCFSAVMHQRMQAARMQALDLYGPIAGRT